MHWHLLHQLVEENPIEGFSFRFMPMGTFEHKIPSFYIAEKVGEFEFEMIRSVTGEKRTIHDDLNMVGLNSLNLEKNRCFLTEGVSDFIATKLITGDNVLGIVTLSGSSLTRRILKGIFDEYYIIGDNDMTGVNNMVSLGKELKQDGKKVKFLIPPPSVKDPAIWLYNKNKQGAKLGNELKRDFLISFSY